MLVHVIFQKTAALPGRRFPFLHTASVISKIAFPTVRNSVTGRGGVEKVLTLNLTADEKALFEQSLLCPPRPATKRLASKPVFTSR